MKFTSSIEYGLHNDLKRLSEMTRIPISKLLDEAIKDLLKKHKFRVLLEEYKNKKDEDDY